jgi:hypothetical protein
MYLRLWCLAGIDSTWLNHRIIDCRDHLHAQGEWIKSLEVYEVVGSVTRKWFGDRHPFVARLDIIIGNLYLETGNVNNSLRLFTEAPKIDEELGLPTVLILES